MTSHVLGMPIFLCFQKMLKRISKKIIDDIELSTCEQSKLAGSKFNWKKKSKYPFIYPISYIFASKTLNFDLKKHTIFTV